MTITMRHDDRHQDSEFVSSLMSPNLGCLHNFHRALFLLSSSNRLIVEQVFRDRSALLAREEIRKLGLVIFQESSHNDCAKLLRT